MSNGTIIARGGLELRKSPKTGKPLKKLRRNAAVEILAKETWVRVRTRDGAEGYVLADFVETTPAELFPPLSNGAAAPAAAASPSPVCDIRVYRNTCFIGTELRADFDFFAQLDRINAFAENCDVEIFVTSSTREPGRSVSGAIVPPATRSNHLVGHGIDMNVKAASGFFNSQALRLANLPNLPANVARFIQSIRDDGALRWGGDFTPEDPVHIDDDLNHRDPILWDAKLASRR